jgi:hypothetical protein
MPKRKPEPETEPASRPSPNFPVVLQMRLSEIIHDNLRTIAFAENIATAVMARLLIEEGLAARKVKLRATRAKLRAVTPPAKPAKRSREPARHPAEHDQRSERERVQS